MLPTNKTIITENNTLMRNTIRHRSIMLYNGLLVTVGACDGDDTSTSSGFMNIISNDQKLTQTKFFPDAEAVNDVIEISQNSVVIVLLIDDNIQLPYSKFVYFYINITNKGICLTDITEPDGLPIVNSACRFSKKYNTNFVNVTNKLILLKIDEFQHINNVETFESISDTESVYILDNKFELSSIGEINHQFYSRENCTEALVEFKNISDNRRIRDIIFIHPNLRSINHPVINHNHLIFNYTAFNNELQVNEHFTFVQPYSIVNNCLLKSNPSYSI